MKAKLHRSLRYSSSFQHKDSFDLAQPKVLEVAVGTNTADLAEGPRQSTLVDSGYAAQICHVHDLF